jgi:hypothetical protein
MENQPGMSHMSKWYYRLGRILSEGKGRQLVWLIGILVAVLFLITIIVRSFFVDEDIHMSNILALFFSVDSLNDSSGLQTAVMLVIALIGTLLFSTFLISIITNIVDNISESYRVGKIQMKLSGHTVFLGANHLLIGMLREISENGDTGEILILTTSNVGGLRELVYSSFEGTAYVPFRKRMVFEYAERDQKENLKAACVADARRIFILGEEDEPSHDSRSISAVNILSRLCKSSAHEVPCYVVLEDPASSKAFVMKGRAPSVEQGSRLRLNLIDAYDYRAEQVLTAISHTPIDHRIVPDGGSVKVMEGIGKDAQQFVHLVIAGKGQMAEAFARTAFAMLHFPNFDEKTLERRTVISVVSPDAHAFMERMNALYENLFSISHYRFVGQNGCDEHAPDPRYGDFLDIEWEFIEGNMDTPSVRRALTDWVSDNAQSLSISLCDSDSAKNAIEAISLPRAVYDRKTPVFVYQKDDAHLLNVANQSPIYGDSLIPFGMADFKSRKPDWDPLFVHQFDMARRVYHVSSGASRDKASGADGAWNRISESDKLSSVYCALSIPLKVRSFGIDITRPIADQLSDDDRKLLDRVEHRRWVAGSLLLGFYPMTQEERRALSSLDENALQDMVNENKSRFIHWNLAPFDVIKKGEQEKDALLMNAIPYIMSGNIDLL